eukprot:TRINITY_DN778054_c0_g1_i1.p1 TRINITY_DN778054_c0_g1~~TRINITY_DN778054_c0_g1_i1.p1  ORF type:complete len:219 (-),score=91.02 TRINITY_DN778054_c0_g1_i1:125-742(-)
MKLVLAVLFALCCLGFVFAQNDEPVMDGSMDAEFEDNLDEIEPVVEDAEFDIFEEEDEFEEIEVDGDEEFEMPEEMEMPEMPDFNDPRTKIIMSVVEKLDEECREEVYKTESPEDLPEDCQMQFYEKLQETREEMPEVFAELEAAEGGAPQGEPQKPKKEVDPVANARVMKQVSVILAVFVAVCAGGVFYIFRKFNQEQKAAKKQ